MLNLFDIENGENCRVLWLPGPANLLRGLISLSVDAPLFMVSNQGKNGVIVKKGEKSYAMSADLAEYVRVEKE